MPEFSEDLQRLNKEAVETLIPVLVFICILMVMGTLGNPIVVYFYGWKQKPTSSFMFIVALAVFDFIISTVSMPLEIVDIVRFYTFESPVACKILRFVNSTFSFSSGGILIAIAIDRYRKVCQPLKTQISLKMAGILIAIILVSSIVISSPSLLFYTVIAVNLTEHGNIQVYDCTTIRDEQYMVYITIFNIVAFICFLIAISTLVTFYSLIGKRIFQMKTPKYYPQETGKCIALQSSEIQKATTETVGREEVFNFESEEIDRSFTCSNSPAARSRISNIDNDVIKHEKSRLTKCCTELDSTNDPGFSKTEDLTLTDISKTSNENQSTDEGKETEQKRISIDKNDYDTPQSQPTYNGTYSIDIREHPTDVKTLNKQKSRHINAGRYTVVMLSITVAFIVSFLPYLGLATWRTLSDEYEPNLLSKSELIAFQIFIRSFLINSATNPLIYGVLNTDFRHFVISLLCCKDKIHTRAVP